MRDITRKLTLRDRLLDVQRQAAQVREQLAQALLDRVSLALDRARLTSTLNDDLAALNRIEAAVRQQIATVGRTVELERQLIDIESQRQALAEQQRDQVRQQREAVLQQTRDRLALAVERAAGTASFADDLRALQAQERFVREQIAAQGRTIDLERELLGLQQERARVLEQQRQAQKQARDARQFRALGLGPSGEERIPGLKALRNQLGSITDAVKGTFLDTGKTRSLLAQIRRVLSGGLGAVSEEVRQKIAEMLADIDRQLAEKKGGPFRSKFRVVDADKVLANLGLSRDQIRAASQRLASLGPGSTMSTGGRAAFGAPVAGGGGMVFTGPITVVANDPDVFMRKLQNKARRRATQTTGASAGNGMGFVR